MNILTPNSAKNFLCFDLIRSKDNKPLQKGNISDDLTGGKSKLSILNVRPEDSGNYMCVSQADIGKAKWKTYYHINIYSR